MSGRSTSSTTLLSARSNSSSNKPTPRTDYVNTGNLKYTPRYPPTIPQQSSNHTSPRQSHLSTPSILNRIDNKIATPQTPQTPVYGDENDDDDRFEDSLDYEINHNNSFRKNSNNNNNLDNYYSRPMSTQSSSLVSVDINNIYNKNKNKLDLLQVFIYI